MLILGTIMVRKTPTRDIKPNIIISQFMLPPVRIHKNVMCHCYKEIHENLTNLAPGEHAHVDTEAL